MQPADRRNFLKTIAAMTAAGALPATIAKALALPADRRTGTIADVEHIVVLMQENRSFDHYYGTLRGVRGFGDPRPLMLRSGKSVFHQPAPDGAHEVLPFHLNSRSTSAPMMKSLDHSWKGSFAEWANYDVWVKHKTPLTMGHFKREDIPFYHALADAFTICDSYFCSLHGPTNPNRMYLFSGTSGLAIGNDGEQAVHNADDGNWTADMARDKPDYAGMRWTTYAERLQAAGINWRVYQEYDNYGDNSLAYFAHFRDLDPSSELYRRARAYVAGSTAENAGVSEARHLVSAFAADVQTDRLPQVSWIVAPYKFTEHPEATPAHGESFVARLIDALTANPQVWAKTVFIINYDENDGFFDHMPGPIPATDRSIGLSSVNTRGEIYKGVPVGLGIRVPLLIVSPWTRGGWVNSEIFDHTSVIRFIERRFGVMEPNITPWRRAVTGDLTSMFDFEDPDQSALSGFPNTSDYHARMAASATLPNPAVPAIQSIPVQEPGQRPARPLPYKLHVHSATMRGARLQLTFVNEGTAGAVFSVFAKDGAAGPWAYTVGAGKTLRDPPPGLPLKGRYALAVHGPGGFLREFEGDLDPEGGSDSAQPEVEASSDPAMDSIILKLVNRGRRSCRLSVRPLAYGEHAPEMFTLVPGDVRIVHWDVTGSDHWYDLLVEMDGAHFRRRLAGHIETGRPSRSDPAIGRLVTA